MNSHRKEAVGLVQIFYSSSFSKRARSCAYPCSRVWEYAEDVLRRSGLCWVKFSVCLFLRWRERGKARYVARGETEMVSNSRLRS